jgi:diguanylate cyclase
MNYFHSREESAEILRLALQLMAPHKAAFHPLSYAVWYEHAAEVRSMQQITSGFSEKLSTNRAEVESVVGRLERAQTEPLRDPLTGLHNRNRVSSPSQRGPQPNIALPAKHAR